MRDETQQAALFTAETITETKAAPATVWVIASRKEGSPHPYVEGVYDSEAEARTHLQELRDNAFQHGVVAWDVFERPVETSFDGGDDDE